jgi:hypothetical protein
VVCTALRLARFPLLPAVPSELAAIWVGSVIAMLIEAADPATVVGTLKKFCPALYRFDRSLLPGPH